MKRLVLFAYSYFRALWVTLVTFLGGFLWGKQRRLIDKINEYTGYKRKNITPAIPKVLLEELVHGKLSVELREERPIAGNMSLYEMVVIAKLVRYRQPRAVFEIGTFDGRSTLNLAANSTDAHVYTLDLPREEAGNTKFPLNKHDRYCVEKERSGARFVGTDCEKRISQLYGDSANFNYLPFVGAIDFVIVDGAHSYDYVLSDSRSAIRLIRPHGGIILWHDYDEWDGVTAALNQLYAENPTFKNIRWIEGTTLACLVVPGQPT